MTFYWFNRNGNLIFFFKLNQPNLFLYYVLHFIRNFTGKEIKLKLESIEGIEFRLFYLNVMLKGSKIQSIYFTKMFQAYNSHMIIVHLIHEFYIFVFLFCGS